MFLLNKSNNKSSSRKQIQIKEVRDGILVLPNNRYRMVLETSSVNFELKSDEEQDVLLESFQNFLNSLATPLQILIRVREVDVDNYLEQIAKRKSAEKEAVYREQIDNYSDFIKQVVSGNKILTRRFYIVVPYDNQSKDKDFSIISEQMNLQKDLVMRAIEKLGMKARAVDSFELLNLFYTFYNPNQVKTQELTRESIRALLEGLYA